MKNNRPIIVGIIGLALTIFGFMTSDATKYPVASKFSGVMIVVGVFALGLAVATKWNPLA